MQCSIQHLYISPAMRPSIWPVVIIPRPNSGPLKFFIQKPYLTGKILSTKSLLQGHKFEANFKAFDKICGQMLKNFIAFGTVFHNFHVALFFY